jgi:uncharacterized protein (TIGR00251 family)
MAIIIEVKVVPQSGKTGCKLEHERLKCFLKSAPEKGKANKELLSYFAKKLNLPAAAVQLMSGATHRLKRVQIDAELSFEDVCMALGIERQMTFIERS